MFGADTLSEELSTLERLWQQVNLQQGKCETFLMVVESQKNSLEEEDIELLEKYGKILKETQSLIKEFPSSSFRKLLNHVQHLQVKYR